MLVEFEKGFKEEVLMDDVFFICIGTDRGTGDSLGPIVGTYLTRLGYENVYGTIDNPVHAENLKQMLGCVPEGKKIVAVDAMLGRATSVGNVYFKKGPLKPGAGVKKDLGSVGNYSISGCVNVGGLMEYMVLQNTRLSIVMRMAEQIVSEIVNLFPLNQVFVASSGEGDEQPRSAIITIKKHR